jgi:ADP-ribosyl-[dinitrogen reductase] hydrolase
MRADRVVGILVGAAAGDALGAPYEFGPAGELTRVGAEMAGGGGFGWKPGEWTDDTQMSLHIAASLLAHDGINEADQWDRFRTWSQRAADVGVQTRRVLGSGKPWQTAASDDFGSGLRSAGNGSLMRTVTAALFFAAHGPQASADAARRISALTHGDPRAGECCVVLHELIRVGLSDADPIGCLGEALDLVLPDHRGFLVPWLAPTWEPNVRDNNGVSWVTLAQAVWAVRSHDSFAAALRAVVDLGGDTDTVACVTGALAGARWGVQAVPSAWTTVLNGLVPGDDQPIAHDLESLHSLAFRLAGWTPKPLSGLGPPLPVVEVASHLFATDLAGARDAEGYEVVSLCRTGGLLTQARQVWLIDSDDEDDNPQLDLAVRDAVREIERLRAAGHDVLLHCHRGESRTGLVARAWMQQVQGLSYGEALQRFRTLREGWAPWNNRFESYLLDL